MIALVQAAANLPTFILSLPGGALADVVDRKRLRFGHSYELQSGNLITVGASIKHEVESLDESVFLLTIPWPDACHAASRLRHLAFG